MKVRVSSIIFILVFFCIAIECKWHYIFGTDSFYWIRQIICVLLFVYCRFARGQYIKKYCKFIDSFLLLMLFLTIIELGFTVFNSGITLAEATGNAIGVCTKFLLVYPLLYLMETKSVDKVARWIVIIAGIALLYQAFAAIIYNTSGSVINELFIASEERTRNGMIRIATSCLNWFILAILFPKFLEAKRFVEKAVSLGGSVIVLAFLLFVNQSRSLYVAAILMMVAMYLFKNRRSKRQLVIICIFFVVVVLFTQSDIFASFVSSFAKGTEGDTLTFRFTQLGRIYSQFLSHPLTGFGFVGNTTPVTSTSDFYFVDYGFIGDFIEYGIWAVIIYFGTIGRIFFNILYQRKTEVRNQDYLLNIGILIFMLAGLVGFTLLDSNRNLALPVIWAFSEYSHYSLQESIANEDNFAKHTVLSKC